MKKIAIIDYEMNNLFSIKNAMDFLGYNSVITSDIEVINNSDGVILPGVGAFPVAMDNLAKLGLVKVINNFANTHKPLLGICLGMQLLFETSSEFYRKEGLGILKGEVRGFSENLNISRIPHVGWNKVLGNNKVKKSINLLDQYFYFVHSFFVKPQNEKEILGYTIYENFNFCSIIEKKNILGCQFHPEKSGSNGLILLDSFFNDL